MSVTDELWLHATAVAYALVEVEVEVEVVGAGREEEDGAVVDILCGGRVCLWGVCGQKSV